MVRFIGRSSALLACMFAVLLVSAAAASAAPAWRLVSLASTAVAPGATLGYQVIAQNAGDAATDGSTITLTGTLPAGLTFLGSFGPLDCSSTAVGASIVDCESAAVVPPGDSLSARTVIKVAVSPLASGVLTSSFEITGGDPSMPSAATVDPTRITTLAPGFGFDAFDFQVAGDAVGDPYTQAGGHPYAVATNIDFNTLESRDHLRPNVPVGGLWPVEAMKDTIIDLPAGLTGDPSTLVKCTASDLVNGLGINPLPLCVPESQVGTALVKVNGFGFLRSLIGPVPVFNMVAPPGAVARFGFNVLGTIVALDVKLRSGTDYGITVESSNTSEGLAIAGTTVTLWGDPSDPGHTPERTCPGEVAPYNGGPSCASDARSTALLRNPTSCTPLGVGAAVSAHVDSWVHPGAIAGDGTADLSDPAWKTASLGTHALPGYPTLPEQWGTAAGVTGCALVPFDPSIEVTPSTHAPDAPSGLDVSVGVPQEALTTPGAISQADVKKIVVALPEGMTVNPSAASGLEACAPAQIALHSAGGAGCPDASKVGSAEIKVPALDDPLEGSVYLASQGDNPFGSLLAVYLVAEGHGVVVKVAGRIDADPVTGRLTATFDDLPQQPIDSAHLSFFSGPHAALATSAACGGGVVASSLEGWNGRTVSLSSPTSVDCVAGLGGFNPVFAAGTTNPQAGGFSPFTLTFSRNDGEQALSGLTVKTPPGFSAILRSVERCPEPQAAQGACGDGGLIGHVTAAVGAGPDPFYATGGRAFLTGPYRGAPFGLDVVIPAKAGPFDLGTVVVRSRVEVDPRTAQITITSDPFPRVLQGIPLRIRTVNVTVDRQGFAFNPTNCSPLSVDGTIASAQGASATVSSHFQAANCAALAFHPSFKVSTKAGTSKKGGAALDVKVASGVGQANLGKVAVSLPRQLPSRLTTIQQACTEVVFNQNPAACPVGSNIGVGTATTPILASPVLGPVYLVSHGGAAFPDIVMVLQGEGVTVQVTGSINIKKGVTSSAFNAIPDVPISSFDLSLPQGPHSALGTNLPAKAKGSLCGQGLVMPTTLTGQNGAVVKQSTKIAVTGCPKAKKHNAKKHTRGAHGKKGKGK